MDKDTFLHKLQASFGGYWHEVNEPNCYAYQMRFGPVVRFVTFGYDQTDEVAWIRSPWCDRYNDAEPIANIDFMIRQFKDRLRADIETLEGCLKEEQ